MTSYRTTDTIDAIRTAVAAHADDLGGVFRREHLVAWGIDPILVMVMVRRRHWVRLRHGVYCDRQRLEAANSRDRHLLDAAAAIWALRGDARAFGPTAAVVHGLPLPDDAPTRISLVRARDTDPRGAYHRLNSTDGLLPVVTRRATLTDSDVTAIGGIQVVSRALAAFSAGAECSLERAICLLDAAAWQEERVIIECAEYLDQWPRLRGIGVLRRAVPLMRTGAQSPLESISRVRLVNRGLPEPQLQMPFHDRAGLIGYTDMTWRDWKVIGECDGLAKYQSRDDLVAEKRREDRLRALGFTVVRWTWDDIVSRPGEVAARIRAAARLGTTGLAG